VIQVGRPGRAVESHFVRAFRGPESRRYRSRQCLELQSKPLESPPLALSVCVLVLPEWSLVNSSPANSGRNYA